MEENITQFINWIMLMGNVFTLLFFVTTRILKTVFTASLLGAHHKRDRVEKKPVSLLVVFLDNLLNGIFPSLRGKQVLG